MDDDNDTTDSSRLNFLDFIVVLAESWPAWLLGTLLVAIAAGVYVAILPATYETSAVVRVLSELDGADLLRRANVRAGSETVAPAVVLVTTLASGTAQIRVRHPEPAQAKRQLDLIVGVLVDDNQKMLEYLGQTAQRQTQTLRVLEQMSVLLLERITPAAGADGATLVEPAVQVITQVGDRQGEVARLEREIAARQEAAAIVEGKPTDPVALPRDYRLSVALPTVVALVLLLTIAFVRDAVRRAATSPAGAAKVRRIRDAFRLPGFRRAGSNPGT